MTLVNIHVRVSYKKFFFFKMRQIYTFNIYYIYTKLKSIKRKNINNIKLSRNIPQIWDYSNDRQD